MIWEQFLHYRCFVRNHRSPVDSSHKRPITRGFGVSFGVSLYKLLNKHSSCRCETLWWFTIMKFTISPNAIILTLFHHVVQTNNTDHTKALHYWLSVRRTILEASNTGSFPSQDVESKLSDYILSFTVRLVIAWKATSQLNDAHMRQQESALHNQYH